MKIQKFLIIIFCLFIVLFVLGCNKATRKAEIISDSEYHWPGFKTKTISIKTEYDILSYEYLPDLESVGYNAYGIYEGNLYIVRHGESFTPILNVVKNKEKTFGEKLHLEEMKESGNTIHLKYHVEPYGNLASCFGTVEISFEYNSGVFRVVNYYCDIKSRFSVDSETGDEYPDINGDIIYKIDFLQEDFMKILNDINFEK